MSEWDGIEELKLLLKEKGIVQRERTPVEVMLWAVYDHLIGASLRRARDAISHLCRRSHEAVHEWVQKIGGYVRKTLANVNGDLPCVLVADETELNVGGRILYLWVALDPATRAIFHLALTEGRNILFARSFLLGIKARYGSLPKLLITDGGVWYPSACRQLGVRHEWVVGGIRSYVERWNETLKDRDRLFDGYFPCSGKCGYEHILNWCFLFAFYYNHVRRHMSRGNRPPLGNRRGRVGSEWRRLLSRLTRALT
jgi:putative transposase